MEYTRILQLFVFSLKQLPQAVRAIYFETGRTSMGKTRQ